MTRWALPASDTYFAPILAADGRGFQLDHLEFALSHCKSFRTAIDGGAHIGTWSVAMSKRFERVIAFEPAPDTFKCLVKNLDERACVNVDAVPAALGAVRGCGNIVDDPKRIGNTGARHLGAGMGNTGIWPLDNFELKDVDFLKFDVEGYEYHALKGAEQTLKRWRPLVLIEVKNFGVPRFGCHHEKAPEYLASIGYREVARMRNDRVYV